MITALALGASISGASAFQSTVWTGRQQARILSSVSPKKAATLPLQRRSRSLPPLMMAPSDEALLDTTTGGRGGMFTSSNPEDRRIVPEAPGDRAKFKVVYVVLESQYQASMSKAAARINEGQAGVCTEVVGYLLEELRDGGNYAR